MPLDLLDLVIKSVDAAFQRSNRSLLPDVPDQARQDCPHGQNVVGCDEEERECAKYCHRSYQFLLSAKVPTMSIEHAEYGGLSVPDHIFHQI